MGRDTLMKEQQELFNDIQSIDASNGTKICKKCNEEVATDNFHKVYYRKNGTVRYSNVCLRCANKSKNIRRKLREMYPYPSNKYVCPICLTRPTQQQDINIISKHNSFCMDHDHETGEFRGWLCHLCNAALGWFEDDSNRLRRAVNYLEKSA